MARFKNRNTGTIVSVEDGRELPAAWEEIVETPANETPANEKPAPKSRAKKTASSDEDE